MQNKINDENDVTKNLKAVSPQKNRLIESWSQLVDAAFPGVIP